MLGIYDSADLMDGCFSQYIKDIVESYKAITVRLLIQTLAEKGYLCKELLLQYNPVFCVNVAMFILPASTCCVLQLAWAFLRNRFINLIVTAIVCRDCSGTIGPLYTQDRSAFPTPLITATEAICHVANCHLYEAENSAGLTTP